MKSGSDCEVMRKRHSKRLLNLIQKEKNGEEEMIFITGDFNNKPNSEII
jgi:hypothetical protein